MYKFIPLEENPICYPVGPHIQKNTPAIREMAKAIKKEYPKRTLVFWVRGSSGAIIAAMISGFLRKQDCVIHYVRKIGEDSHGGAHYLHIEDGVHIIVDDFMSSGTTVNIIHQELRDCGEFLNCLCLTDTIWLEKIDDILSNNIEDNLVIMCKYVEG